MPHRLIFLPGLNGDSRVFRELILHFPTAEVVNWLDPLRRESISSYAIRVAAPLGNLQGAILVGVSFGGIIAQEIAANHGMKACIVISSVRGPKELPPHYRAGSLAARLPVENLISTAAFASSQLPSSLLPAFARPLSKLRGKGSYWRRWAIGAVLRWRPPERRDLKITQIHGDRDLTFPIRYLNPDVTIPGGGHLVALTHATEIAKIISTWMDESASYE